MAMREKSVKRYVVRLGCEERDQLEALIRKGKSPAQRLLKARILLKADVSQAGDGWSDSRIMAALETSASMVYRVRKQLVEEGLEAVLSRKRRATPAVAPIFDGEKEAKFAIGAATTPRLGLSRLALSALGFLLAPRTRRTEGSKCRSCRVTTTGISYTTRPVGSG